MIPRQCNGAVSLGMSRRLFDVSFYQTVLDFIALNGKFRSVGLSSFIPVSPLKYALTPFLPLTQHLHPDEEALMFFLCSKSFK